MSEPRTPGPGKTLIVCCDGTWNKPDQSGGPTNVTKMARAILPHSAAGEPQIVYYDQGIGTGNILDRALGGVLGAHYACPLWVPWSLL